MSAYCLRVFRGRARLRHPVLADAAVRQNTADSLALLDGVAGVSQGYSSVLLELKPDADPEAIRRALRAAVPAGTASVRAESSCACSCFPALPAVCSVQQAGSVPISLPAPFQGSC